MKKQLVIFFIIGLAGIVFTPRELYAKSFFTEKVARHANSGISDDQDSFVDSNHLPLEEDY